MKRAVVIAILALCPPVAPAQSDDLAAERARIANQRIEAEARAREEQERQARLAAEREQAAASQSAAPSAATVRRETAAATPVPSATREGAPSPADVDRMLQQIRTLGELRDAGYVTDSEFERIKRRILDGTL